MNTASIAPFAFSTDRTISHRVSMSAADSRCIDMGPVRPASAPPALGLLDDGPSAVLPALPPPRSVVARVRSFWASPTVSGLACATLAGVCSGGATPLIALATQTGGPVAASALMQAGTAAVATFALPMPQQGLALWPITPRMGFQLAGATLFSAVLAPDALLVAYRQTSAASVALAMNLEPLVTAALEWPIFKHRPSKHVLAASVATLASAGLCAAGQLKSSPSSGEGIGFAAAAAVAFAAGNLCIGGLADRKPQQIVSASSIVGAGISAAVSGALHETFPTGREACFIVGCGVLMGAAACLLTASVQRVGVGRSALLFSIVDLTVGVTASCAAGQGTMTAFIGASLGVALLGAAVLGHEAISPAKRAIDVEAAAASVGDDA